MTWENFSKAILFFVFACLIIRERHHFNFFVWVIVLSIGFMGFVEGLKFISSGGGHHIKGPNGNILSDNNHMAVALCMTIPFIIYLIPETNEKLIKNGLRVMLVICILAVLGTYSRGGFIGLVIVLGYFFLKSHHKFKGFITLLIVGTLAVNFLPSSWYNRMDSIDNPMGSGSFTTRVNSWKIHTEMAIERPLIGGGFKGPLWGVVWRRLAMNIGKFDFIETPPPGKKAWAAHSIYFQVLGDHGFIGLFLFLSIIFLSFTKLSAVQKYYANLDGVDNWHARLAQMIKVSLVAYCVAVAAVSLAYVELLYAILAIVVSLHITLLLDKKERAEA
jgi:probable O-glycosylation ligase (exosortase A-associated)